MNHLSIAFLGAGRITRILVQRWMAVGRLPRKIAVYDRDPSRSAAVTALAPGSTAVENTVSSVIGADVVFLAIHPPILPGLLAEIGPILKPGALVVSLAPKHTLAAMQNGLGGHPGLARVNPGVSGLVGRGLNPWCATPETTAEQIAWLEALLEPLGKTPRVAEAKIEAYAVISAMGPTYFWFQWKLLEDLAIEFGLDPAEARATVAEMVRGAADTLFDSALPAAEVMDLVPVKPLGDQEATLTALYREKLTDIFNKIRP